MRVLEPLAWTAFFALALGFLGLRYWLLPDVERYREDIVARVAATVGQPVKIGRIEAAWLGLRPQITLTDVRIYDAEGREALRLPSVENILAWRSLVYRDLRLHSIVIDGPQLTVRRDASGALEIAGVRLRPGAGGDASGGFADWLLGQGDIEIRNAQIEWRDDKRGAHALALSAVNLHLRSDGARHALGLSARLPLELGERLELRAELAGGAPGAGGDWSGRLYAELGYADLAAWREWLDLPIGLARGAGALRLWTSVENGAWRAASADIAAADVAVVFGEALPALELDSLRGRLQARVLADGYQLTGRQLAVAGHDGAAIGPADFQLAWRRDGGALSANAVELAPLARLALALPLPEELRRLADDLEPRGQLADLSYQWEGPVAAPRRFQARGRCADLGLRPWGGIPGFARFAGALEASESGGRVYLQARNAEIELPRVFPQPRVAFDTLSGQVDWQQEAGRANEPGRFSARLTSVNFANADLSGSAFGAFTRSGPGPGAIDLSATLTRADARRVARYLPLASIMGEKPRQWLVEGIVGGQASDVHLRLRGNLADFPYADPAKGQFLVTARVQNGVLSYADGWPRIEAIDADLHFERSRMDIVGRSGAILGAHLAKVRVSIPNLGSRQPQLSVAGEAAGPTAEFLKYIVASPVRRMIGGFTDGVAASGNGRLRLGLELPLANLEASRVAGEYEFAGNELQLHPKLPPIERAVGRLSFTEASFSAHEVRGRLFGGPVALAGGTRGKGVLEFTARGDAAAPALDALPEAWRHFLSGQAPYAASLAIRDGGSRLLVDSSLRGLASSLPAPLGKSADEPLPLRLEVRTSEGGARERIVASLGKLLAVEAMRAGPPDKLELERAGIWLGPLSGQTLRLPAQGVSIQGSLPALDLDAWRSATAGTASGAGPGPLLLDVKLVQLQAYGKRFNGVALRASGAAQRWSAMVAAAELDGQLAYQGQEGGRLIARFARFEVPPDSGSAKRGASFKPGELPALDLVAERFSVGGKPLGRVELAAHPEGDDWRIDKLAMANEDATLRASAWWRGGAATRTALDFSLEANDAGKLLDRLGYAGLVLGGTAHLEGTVSWQGAPLALDTASLSGDLRMNAEDGQFLEIDPGIGKLISLMSLQALPRRVALDFRDVFSKGFRFDRIDAVSHVERGVMQIGEFRMRGPAADVRMSGEADLARETQDLRVRVVPGLGDSASTVLTIVNPVAGVTAALAQRVLKNPLGQIFAHEFSVTGGWAEPQVTRLNPPGRPSESASP